MRFPARRIAVRGSNPAERREVPGIYVSVSEDYAKHMGSSPTRSTSRLLVFHLAALDTDYVDLTSPGLGRRLYFDEVLDRLPPHIQAGVADQIRMTAPDAVSHRDWQFLGAVLAESGVKVVQFSRTDWAVLQPSALSLIQQIRLRAQ